MKVGERKEDNTEDRGINYRERKKKVEKRGQ